MNYMYRLALVNLFLIASVIVGWSYGYVGPIFKNDSSYISYLIATITSINILFAFLDCRSKSISETPYMRWMQFTCGKLLYIGLAGTLIGFKGLLIGLNTSTEPAAIIMSVKEGCLTLANTTLLGLVGFLWANLNFYLLGEE